MKPIDVLNEKRSVCLNCYSKGNTCWTCHWNQFYLGCDEPCTKSDWKICVYNHDEQEKKKNK